MSGRGAAKDALTASSRMVRDLHCGLRNSLKESLFETISVKLEWCLRPMFTNLQEAPGQGKQLGKNIEGERDEKEKERKIFWLIDM